MEWKINKLHRNMLEAELRILVSHAPKAGGIHEKDLKQLLTGVPMTEEHWQALYRKLEEREISLIPESEGGSLYDPTLEELQAVYAADTPALEYLKELEKNGITRCLPVGAEKDLAEKQDEASENALMEGNLLRVVSIARQYLGLGMIPLDLFSEGNRGLLEARKAFLPDTGTPFLLCTVCCIREGIRSGLDGICRDNFRIPEQVVKAVLGMEGTSDPTPRIPIWDSRGQDPQKAHPETDYKALLEELLEGLTPRETDVIRLRLGLTDGTPHTMDEVARHFGITRERVRQIENKFIRQGNRARRSRRIRDFYG